MCWLPRLAAGFYRCRRWPLCSFPASRNGDPILSHEKGTQAKRIIFADWTVSRPQTLLRQAAVPGWRYCRCHSAKFGISELELCLELNHSWGIVAADAAKETGWRGRQINNLAESLILDLVVRKPEIRMVKDAKELESNPQCGIFPARDLRVLHDREIRIEVAWSAKTIATLRELNRRSTTRPRRPRQIPGIKPCFASCLNESRMRTGR